MNQKHIDTIHAVINTINATNLRADQVEAVNRLNACARILLSVVQEMKADDDAKASVNEKE